ncbi:hypothetical protein ETB97_011178, partial [Aspergillus alliaceus]
MGPAAPDAWRGQPPKAPEALEGAGLVSPTRKTRGQLAPLTWPRAVLGPRSGRGDRKRQRWSTTEAFKGEHQDAAWPTMYGEGFPPQAQGQRPVGTSDFTRGPGALSRPTWDRAVWGFESGPGDPPVRVFDFATARCGPAHFDTSVPEDPPVGDFGGRVRSWGVGLRDGEVTTAGSPKEC